MNIQLRRLKLNLAPLRTHGVLASTPREMHGIPHVNQPGGIAWVGSSAELNLGKGASVSRTAWLGLSSTARLRFLVIAGAALALFVLIFAVVPNPSQDARSSTEAINQCQFAVTDRLSAPTTAIFTSQAKKTAGNLDWVVSGSVKSPNASGAETTSTFQCSVDEGPRTDNTTINWIH